VWKTLRILILLLVLGLVAGQQLIDRLASRSWHEPLWVGIYPLNADGTDGAQRYVAALTPEDFTDIESFFGREAARYGIKVERPVHIELYPQGTQLPPRLDPDAGPFGNAWWSLKLRWFAAWHTPHSGQAPSRIRIFVLYHDPSTLEQMPDSHGLQKGLLGVVHAFADDSLTGADNLVIAHELLHTVGASDKYDLATDQPLYPSGYADPGQQPLYPQAATEIMAGRRPLSATASEMPHSLRHVLVGPATALEIGWTHP
jgi:hypothetical protein